MHYCNHCDCTPCCCPPRPVCNPCPTSTTTTIPICDTVNDCVREDLQKTLADQEDPVIDNICAVARKCVNDGLGNYIDGTSSGLNNFTEAVHEALRALPGYSESGQKYLNVINGILQWLAPNGTTTTSTTTTINPALTSTTTTLVLDTIYYGATILDGDPDELEILSGDSVLTDGGNDVAIDWTPYNDDLRYLWFAIPARTSNHEKDTFFFNEVDNGPIGGVEALFDYPVTVEVAGVDYLVWTSNYATQVSEIGIFSK